MALLGFLLLMGLLSWYEIPRIIRHGGERGEVVAFVSLMLLATGLGSAMILRLPLPNPTDWIEAAFKPISDRLFPMP